MQNTNVLLKTAGVHHRVHTDLGKKSETLQNCLIYFFIELYIESQEK